MIGLNSFAKLLWSFNLFDGNSWSQLFGGLVGAICRALYYTIIVGLARVCDICQLLFKKFAGLSTMKVEGQDVGGDIVLTFINSDIVKNIFWAMLVVAVVILFIATFIATIKTEFNPDGNNNKKVVIKMAFRGLANFLLVPIISIFGIIISNALLKTIDGATNIAAKQTSLSAQIFLVGGYNGNRMRTSEDNSADKGLTYYKEGSFGEMVVGGKAQTNTTSGYANFGIFYDDTTGIKRLRAADKVDDAFASALTINFQNTSLSDFQRTLNFSDSCVEDFYHGGALYQFPDNMSIKEELKPQLGNVDGVYYDSNITFSIYNVGLVVYYYDITFGGFDYLICTIALIFCAYTFVVTILGLIKRLFMLVTLYIISAPICATYPLNNGDALKKWRAEFIKNTLSAYSVVVIMNIFLALLPLMMKIEVFSASDFSSTTGTFTGENASIGLLSGGLLSVLPGLSMLGDAFGFVLGAANYLARVFIVIGALTFFKDATGVVSGLIGAGDAAGDGAKAAGNFAKNVAKVGAGVALTAAGGAGIAKAAGKFVAGGAKLAGKGMNFVGNKAKNALNNHTIKTGKREQVAKNSGYNSYKDMKSSKNKSAQEKGYKNVDDYLKHKDQYEKLAKDSGLGSFAEATKEQKKSLFKEAKKDNKVTKSLEKADQKEQHKKEKAVQKEQHKKEKAELKQENPNVLVRGAKFIPRHLKNVTNKINNKLITPAKKFVSDVANSDAGKIISETMHGTSDELKKTWNGNDNKKGVKNYLATLTDNKPKKK